MYVTECLGPLLFTIGLLLRLYVQYLAALMVLLLLHPPHMPVCALGTEGRNEARGYLAAWLQSKEVQQLAQLLLVRGCCVFLLTPV